MANLHDTFLSEKAEDYAHSWRIDLGAGVSELGVGDLWYGPLVEFGRDVFIAHFGHRLISGTIGTNVVSVYFYPWLLTGTPTIADKEAAYNVWPYVENAALAGHTESFQLIVPDVADGVLGTYRGISRSPMFRRGWLVAETSGTIDPGELEVFIGG